MAFKKLKFWFDKELAELLSDEITKIEPGFKKEAFAQSVDLRVQNLELKDRVEVIADELYERLGNDYEAGLKVLLQIMGPENEEETGMFSNFYWLMPIAKYVEKYGLNAFDRSMHAIEEITKRNTGEYTIRPYLMQYQDETLARMQQWSKSKNRHLRRLASEGLRPRLPWASKLESFIETPKPVLPILNQLKDDPSNYVQKSFANCLNDILKDNKEIGKAVIEEWSEGEIGKERKWIIKHAMRNLLKKNDKWAISILNHQLISA